MRRQYLSLQELTAKMLMASFVLSSSERLIDDQINIAIETKEHMMTQRGALKRIQSRVNDLSSRFPLINSLVQRINFRRRRDAVILGSVIGVCILLLILYSHN